MQSVSIAEAWPSPPFQPACSGIATLHRGDDFSAMCRSWVSQDCLRASFTHEIRAFRVK